MFGGAGLVAWYGLGCLIVCVILAISAVVAAWLAALIVGAALLAVAGAAATGSYNIPSCEISKDPLFGKWSDTNSG